MLNDNVNFCFCDKIQPKQDKKVQPKQDKKKCNCIYFWLKLFLSAFFTKVTLQIFRIIKTTNLLIPNIKYFKTDTFLSLRRVVCVHL